jgi:hypothetical protein
VDGSTFQSDAENGFNRGAIEFAGDGHLGARTRFDDDGNLAASFPLWSLNLVKDGTFG